MSLARTDASVLFVDDDADVLQGLARRMRKEPFQLRTATSGAEALAILAQDPIALVVSDMNMPRMSGMEFLARVAQDYPDCVRIMLTGKPTIDVAIEAINTGEVYRFLTKPYDAGALAAIIRETLEVQDELCTTPGRHRGPGRQRLAQSHGVHPEPCQTHFSTDAKATPESVSISSFSKNFLSRLDDPNFKTRIQQYEIQGLIGKGAMGIVLKGRDPGLARDVALKVLMPSWADSSIAHQRFAQEARYAAAIRHEHVVTVFAVSALGGIPFLVMEYVAGQSLQDWIDQGRHLCIDDVIRIGHQTALGLAAAHELRLIHRDVKPANILLEDRTRSVRITDFGLARAMDSDAELSQQGLLLGTPLYMSPEQVDGKPVGPSSDLFSLGSVLYTLCTGKHPFACSSLTGLLRAIAESTPASVRSLNPTIPDGLAQLIDRLLAKGSDDRPTAAAAAEYLRTHVR